MEAVSHKNQDVSASQQVPLVMEYNTRWKRSARNISTYVYEHSNQLASLKRKSLDNGTMLD